MHKLQFALLLFVMMSLSLCGLGCGAADDARKTTKPKSNQSKQFKAKTRETPEKKAKEESIPKSRHLVVEFELHLDGKPLEGWVPDFDACWIYLEASVGPAWWAQEVLMLKDAKREGNRFTFHDLDKWEIEEADDYRAELIFDEEFTFRRVIEGREEVVEASAMEDYLLGEAMRVGKRIAFSPTVLEIDRDFTAAMDSEELKREKAEHARLVQELRIPKYRVHGKVRHSSGEPLLGALRSSFLYARGTKWGVLVNGTRFMPKKDGSFVLTPPIDDSDEGSFLPVVHEGLDFFGVRNSKLEWQDSLNRTFRATKHINRHAFGYIGTWHGYPREMSEEIVDGIRLTRDKTSKTDFHLSDIVYDYPMVQLNVKFDLGEKYMWKEDFNKAFLRGEDPKAIPLIAQDAELELDEYGDLEFEYGDIGTAGEASSMNGSFRLSLRGSLWEGDSKRGMTKRLLVSPEDWAFSFSENFVEAEDEENSVRFIAQSEVQSFKKGEFYEITIVLKPIPEMDIVVKNEEGEDISRDANIRWSKSGRDFEDVDDLREFESSIVISAKGYLSERADIRLEDFSKTITLKRDPTYQESNQREVTISLSLPEDYDTLARLHLHYGWGFGDEIQWEEEAMRIGPYLSRRLGERVKIAVPTDARRIGAYIAYADKGEAAAFGSFDTRLSDTKILELKAKHNYLNVQASAPINPKGIARPLKLKTAWGLVPEYNVGGITEGSLLTPEQVAMVEIEGESLPWRTRRSFEHELHANIRINKSDFPGVVERVEVESVDRDFSFTYKNAGNYLDDLTAPNGLCEFAILYADPSEQGEFLTRRCYRDVAPETINQLSFNGEWVRVNMPEHEDHRSPGSYWARSLDGPRIRLSWRDELETGKWFVFEQRKGGKAREITLKAGEAYDYFYEDKAFVPSVLGSLEIQLPKDLRIGQGINMTIRDAEGSRLELREDAYWESDLQAFWRKESVLIEGLSPGKGYSVQFDFGGDYWSEDEHDFIFEDIEVIAGEQTEIPLSEMKSLYYGIWARDLRINGWALHPYDLRMRENLHFTADLIDQAGNARPSNRAVIGETYDFTLSAALPEFRKKLPDLVFKVKIANGLEFTPDQVAQAQAWFKKLRAIVLE